MDPLRVRLEKQFDLLDAQSEAELGDLPKHHHVFAIVIGCNVREDEDVLKVQRICSAFARIPCIAYGHFGDEKIAFMLGHAGLADIVPNPHLSQLVQILQQLKERATFHIDLRDFGIDVDQCKSYWCRKFFDFILKDYNFLKYRFVHEIAWMLGISTKHLERECSKDCSRAPKELLLGLKNYYAAYLLDTTLWPAKIIAEKCGFADENKFYQSFHDKTGITTTDFRRHHHWQDFPALFMQNIREKTSKINAKRKIHVGKW